MSPSDTASATGRDLSSYEPGALVVEIESDRIGLDMVGGGSWTLPVGVDTLVDGPLERADRPRPEQLTNALGSVIDHLDDVLIDAPIVSSAPAVVFGGAHAVMVARVEIGANDVPPGYVLDRADADDVFRTIVGESRAERIHNPGLDPDHVDTIVAGCCVVLGVLRRLEHRGARVVS